MGGTIEPLTIGPVRWRASSDGVAKYEKEDLFSDVPAAELEEATAGRLDADGYLLVPYRPSIIVLGDEVLLIDAGTGPDL